MARRGHAVEGPVELAAPLDFVACGSGEGAWSQLEEDQVKHHRRWNQRGRGLALGSVKTLVVGFILLGLLQQQVNEGKFLVLDLNQIGEAPEH